MLSRIFLDLAILLAIYISAMWFFVDLDSGVQGFSRGFHINFIFLALAFFLEREGNWWSDDQPEARVRQWIPSLAFVISGWWSGLYPLFSSDVTLSKYIGFYLFFCAAIYFVLLAKFIEWIDDRLIPALLSVGVKLLAKLLFWAMVSLAIFYLWQGQWAFQFNAFFEL